MKHVFRYLRIAFSATCLIACVLLIVLWVRSYSVSDQIYRVDVTGDERPRHDAKFIGANHGTIHFTNMDLPLPESSGWQLALGVPYVHDTNQFEWIVREELTSIVLPFWVLVAPMVLITAGSAYPWICRRFSLRTLLVATTLVPWYLV
jgi:hypothetical protein